MNAHFNKLAIVATLFLTLGFMPINAEEVSKNYTVVDDFNKGSSKNFSTRWQVYNDAGAGGDSKVVIDISEEKKQLKITGEFGKKFNYPFFGVRTFLNKGGTPVSFKDHKGIRIKFSSGFNFTLQVLTASVTDYNEFSYALNGTGEETALDIPFESFAQNPYFGQMVAFDASKIRGFGIQVNGFPGAAAQPIYIHEVGFYR